MVQEQNRLVELFLIEGHPSIWQSYIQRLGNVDTSAFNNNLLKELVGFTSKVRQRVV